MLRVSNYHNFILHGIDLEIKRGHNVVIIGDNGVGKTTLAKVMSGLIANEAASIDGMPVASLYGSERAKRINYIPPKLEVFDEHIQVGDFLALSDLFSNSSIDEVLELLEIAHLKQQSCRQISSGEAQLLLVAGSLLHNADYTIFDEITANLDPIKQKRVFDILKADTYLQSKIIITHNLHMAYKLGYDILYLKDGQIEFLGAGHAFFSPDNLKKYYADSVRLIDDTIVVNL
jgi:iron complex transport system ATP-binding protein